MTLHLASHLSARWFEVSEGISLWYPPSGLAFAFLLLFGLRGAPLVFGAMVAGAALDPGIHAWWDPWLFPALITTLITLSVHLVRRLHGPVLLPGSTRETATFAVVTLTVPAILAAAGTGMSVLLGLLAPDALVLAVVRWWVGDASGFLTTLPACMVLGAPWLGADNTPVAPLRWRARPAAVFAGRMAVLLGGLWAAFAIEPLAQSNGFFLGFLPLVWISLHHGLPGATAASLALTIGTLLGLHLTQAPTPQVISFLVFELTVAVVGLGIGAAVTKRNRAEQRVLASEARLERVLTGAQLGLWDWHIPSRTTTYNARCAEMLGIPLGELACIEPSWEDFAHPADRSRVKSAMQAHLDGASALYQTDVRVRTRSGAWRWIHSRGSVVERDAGGRPVTVSGTHLDITDRLGTEAEARRLMQIIEVTTDFVLTCDPEGRIVHANAALLRLLGRPTLASLRGCTVADILPADAAAIVTHEAIPAARDARSWLGEISLRDASGRALPVSVVTLHHSDAVDERELLSFTMRDLSPQKANESEKIAQERRLQQFQRNQSLCVLAGGVAHDFNNLLTTVLGNANLARLDLPAQSSQQEYLVQIEAAATRAGELCQLMLAYAGRAPLSFTELDVSELVEGSADLLHVAAGGSTRLHCDLARPIPRVRAARTQLQQVLVNLVQNAAQAIGHGAGAIWIRSRSQKITVDDLATHAFTHALIPGEHVVLEVEDNGAGMSAETRMHIFEPFFTTRFTGQGLGLAAVHGIISSHEGAIEVLSETGRGSVFRIFLPASRTPAAAPTPRVPAHEPNRGAGLALIVDDEPGVLRVTAKLMQHLGYETLLAADGAEGLQQFESAADRLAVVLLDLTMPELSGEELLPMLRERRGSVPVVVMSGYSERLTPESFKACRPAAFLAKPFDRAALQEALQTAMQTRPRAAEGASSAITIPS